jgi:3-methyladenine DNA glycosylase AlkD
VNGESKAFVAEVKRALRACADPKKAEGMRAYMKSEMPYRGAATPERRKACKAIFAKHPMTSFDAWRDSALALWRGAQYREERYAAIALTGLRQYAPYQVLKALPMYEEFIVDGAWWDYVDEVAGHRLSLLLRKYPRAMRTRMRAWAKSRNLWKRRSSILCQLRFKHETDLELLYACIEPSLSSEEFFLRKAIGWALRDLAWTNPREVVRYAERHRDRLSGLTKREALKNVLRSGQLDAIP